jgi:hypothetical protein
VSLRQFLDTYVFSDPFRVGWEYLAFLVVLGLVMKALSLRNRRRLLHHLQSQPRGVRDAQVQQFLYSPDGTWLQRRLADDDLPPREAPIDRFVFPRSVHRWNSIWFWLAIAATAALLYLATTTTRTVTLVTIGAMLAACLVLAAWLRRRALFLATVIEVSPFAISEVHPSGARRTLLWRDAGWLLNRSRRGRVEVATPDKRGTIAVHYRRLEFLRALQLLLDYGGFGPPPSN